MARLLALVLLAVALAWPARGRRHQASAPDEVYSSAKPYGHTSQVHPYHGSRDKEWYVEARWKPGTQYAAQDGDITEKPQHAERPADYDGLADRPKKPAGVLNKKKPASTEAAAANASSNATAEAPPAAAVPVAQSSEAAAPDTVSAPVNATAAAAAQAAPAAPASNASQSEERPVVKLRDPKRESTPPETKYAAPKPYGHTSQVHPTRGNRDREWYVEGRWKPGTEYKAQDGDITEQPQHAPPSLLMVEDFKRHHKHGHHHKKHSKKDEPSPAATAPATEASPPKASEEQITNKMKDLEQQLAKKEEQVKGAVMKGRIEVNGPLPADFSAKFSEAVAAATGCAPSEVKVVETSPVVSLLQEKSRAAATDVVEVVFEAPSDVVKAVEDQAADPDSKLATGALRDFLVAKDDAAASATPVQEKGIDVDTEMPYGELEPFGREDTAQELTEQSIKESDEMVDQLERAEVAEEKRATFRALTRLRGAAITSYDGVARAQTGNIDEYNKVHKWRKTHPLHHLADEESDISKWAFPDNADF